MAWAPDYASVSEIKTILGITDSGDDAILASALSGASRAIDLAAGRQFGKVDTPEARYYGASWSSECFRYVVEIDDLMTTTALVVKTDPDTEGTFDNTLVLDTDFRLAPYNAAAKGRPWRTLILGSGVTAPRGNRRIQVTATFGWTAVPATIKQAAITQAIRFFKRKDAPFGIAGSPDMGSELRLLARLDPDVEVLVAAAGRRYWAAV